MGRCSMLTVCATILFCLFVFRGTNSAVVDADMTAACRHLCSDKDLNHLGPQLDLELPAGGTQLCSDKDRSDENAPSVDQCALGCRWMMLLENRLRKAEKPTDGGGESYIRNNRGWYFPAVSRWQAKMRTSGIGSRSRSAGAFLRIGRPLADTSPSLESGAAGTASIDRRGARLRSAGRYLRIGRTGESADREVMASGTEYDDRPGEDVVHLRKVNREVAVDNDA